MIVGRAVHGQSRIVSSSDQTELDEGHQKNPSIRHLYLEKGIECFVPGRAATAGQFELEDVGVVDSEFADFVDLAAAAAVALESEPRYRNQVRRLRLSILESRMISWKMREETVLSLDMRVYKTKLTSNSF